MNTVFGETQYYCAFWHRRLHNLGNGVNTVTDVTSELETQGCSADLLYSRVS